MSTKITSVAMERSTADSTVIGGSAPAAGGFTTLAASGVAALNGGATTVTQSTSDNSTKVATTAFVHDLLGSYAASLSSNGYATLPSGLILQWGSVSMGSGNQDVGITFPLEFPTAVLQVIAGTVDPTGSGGGDRITYVVAGTATQLGCTLSNNGSGASAVWFAVGY